MGADLQPSDRMFPMTTDWVLLVRYEQNHSSDILITAKCCWSHWRSIEWSMVSNVAERSRRIKQATSWQSSALIISVLTLKSAVSVLCSALQADWVWFHEVEPVDMLYKLICSSTFS